MADDENTLRNTQNTQIDDDSDSSFGLGTISTAGINTLDTFQCPSSSMKCQNNDINNHSSLQLVTCENTNNAAIALSQLSEITIPTKQSCAPEEMERMMHDFIPEIPSTHIFLKPGRGTLHTWEYVSRRYFYLNLIQKMIPDGFLNSNTRMRKKVTHKELYATYKATTGMKSFPPFYCYNKSNMTYTKMNDNQVSMYLSKQFEKIGRLKEKIKRMIVSDTMVSALLFMQ